MKKFHLESAKVVKTPFAQHFKLSSSQSPTDINEVEEMKSVPYANLVGSLMYGMVCSRPDLAYAMSIVSRFMSNLGRPHWDATKWILRFIKGTVNKGLSFTRTESVKEEIVGFVDSDYAADLDKRRSLTGYVFSVFGNVVSWRANLQTVVALSSTEAEYIALSEAVKEAIWLKGSVAAMIKGDCKVNIHCDNQSAIALSKNPTFHDRTKHIDVRFHFVRETVQEGVVTLLKVHTTNNPADMMTKALPSNRLEYLSGLIKLDYG